MSNFKKAIEIIKAKNDELDNDDKDVLHLTKDTGSKVFVDPEKIDGHKHLGAEGNLEAALAHAHCCAYHHDALHSPTPSFSESLHAGSRLHHLYAMAYHINNVINSIGTSENEGKNKSDNLEAAKQTMKNAIKGFKSGKKKMM